MVPVGTSAWDFETRWWVIRSRDGEVLSTHFFYTRCCRIDTLFIYCSYKSIVDITACAQLFFEICSLMDWDTTEYIRSAPKFRMSVLPQSLRPKSKPSKQVHKYAAVQGNRVRKWVALRNIGKHVPDYGVITGESIFCSHDYVLPAVCLLSFSHRNVFFYSPLRASCTAYLNLPGFIILTVFCEEHKLRNSLLFSFLQTPITSPVLGPHAFLSTLISNILS
jgi:hypothetical protein